MDHGVDIEEEVVGDHQDPQEAILEEGEDEVDAVILRILIPWLATGAGCMAIWSVDCPQAGETSQGSGNVGPSQRKFSQPGPKGPKGRGRGRSARFGGLNVLYDEAGNEYPVDDGGQMYVPLGFESVVTEGVNEEEKSNEIKN